MSAAGEAGPASEQNDIDQSLRDYAHRLCWNKNKKKNEN